MNKIILKHIHQVIHYIDDYEKLFNGYLLTHSLQC